MTFRLPLRALPLAIRLVRAGRKALWRVGDVLCEERRAKRLAMEQEARR